MKTKVSVIAIKPFEFKGASYKPDQHLHLTPLDAVVLAKKHLVTLTKRHSSKAVVAEPVDEPKRKRGYKRRDMQAEQTTEMVSAVSSPEPVPSADPYESYRDTFSDTPKD